MFARPSPHKPSPSHSATAVQLIEPVTDYDTNTIAWSKFDAAMTLELEQLELKFRRYWTRRAVITSLRHS